MKQVEKEKFWQEEYNLYLKVFGVICVVAFILFSISCMVWVIFFDREVVKDYNEVYVYIVTAVATIALVIIAYEQIGAMINNQMQSLEKEEARLLLRIDQRWASKPILKARTIINDYYYWYHTLPTNGSSKEEEKMHYEKIYEEVGKEILSISDVAEDTKNISKEDRRKFMLLLNYLDFLETIGFLYIKKLVDPKKVAGISGESFDTNYDIFKLYIEKKRKENNYKCGRYYENFEQLDNKIKEIKDQDRINHPENYGPRAK